MVEGDKNIVFQVAGKLIISESDKFKDVLFDLICTYYTYIIAYPKPLSPVLLYIIAYPKPLSPVLLFVSRFVMDIKIVRVFHRPLNKWSVHCKSSF